MNVKHIQLFDREYLTQEQKCIRLLVYYIDGTLTYSELVTHLSSLNTDIIENFPDNTMNVYPPLEITLRQAVVKTKEENETNEP